MNNTFNKTLILLTLFITGDNLYGESVPLNLGFGPAFNYIPKIIADDQTLHYSLKLDIYAVLDRDFIEAHKSRIPKKYRGFVEGKDELRVSYIFIPESLIISPKYRDTGIYGVNFRPLSLGIPVVKSKSFKSRINLGINLTYAFIYSESIFDKEGNMHFLRPGLNIQFDNIVRISSRFFVSFGADAYFYIPQKIEDGSDILGTGSPYESIWFAGQFYVLLNPRVMYKTGL
ncbi:MAG: hypothetical protein N3B13_10615 [Deltaproteobacteria bacterium]|nr:hypothetical protein [Deltaproteobacteria bacterium]